MKTINSNYKEEVFHLKIAKINAYPNNLLKVEYDNRKIAQIIESPIYIEVKKNILSFTHVETENFEQLDFLKFIFHEINSKYIG